MAPDADAVSELDVPEFVIETEDGRALYRVPADVALILDLYAHGRRIQAGALEPGTKLRAVLQVGIQPLVAGVGTGSANAKRFELPFVVPNRERD